MSKHVLSAGILVLMLAMVGCGGGSSSSSAIPAAVTGTSATGDPLVGAAVTLKDQGGSIKTATTDGSGNFSVDTTGLTPPFLLRVVSSDNTKTFYSVSADSGSSATINITPLTDLIIRSWYNMGDNTVAQAFSQTPPTPAPPAPSLVEVLSDAIRNVMQLWMNHSAVSTVNLISTPFSADGTGIDNVLKKTTVAFGSNTATVVITDTVTTQTSTITYSPTGDNVAIQTTTSTGGDNTTSSYNTFVPVATDGQTALDAIKTAFANFRNTVNGRGSSLSDTDLLTYLDDNLLSGGLGKGPYAKQLAYALEGKAISFTGIAIRSLGTDNADVVAQLSWPDSGLTNIMPLQFFFYKHPTRGWLVSGDRRIAEVEVRANWVKNQGSSSASPSLVLEANVNAPPGTVTAVAITGGPWSDSSMTAGGTNVMPWDDSVTMENFHIYAMDPTGLSGGMPFTVTVTDNAAGVHSYTVPISGVTTETLQVGGLTGSHIDNAHVGSPQTVTWALPSTYPIGRVQLGGVAYAGTPGVPTTYNKCDDQGMVATFTGNTSASITIPATCGGQPTFQAEIYLQVYGINGELSTVYYTYTVDGTSGSWIDM